MKFRDIKASEIDLRPQNIKGNKVLYLLYRDARTDMDILDDSVGPGYWKREHARENKNCIVSIYNPEIKEWVSKEDTGSESNMEKQKGLAADSFKRTCVNWGICRELYTGPIISIKLNDNEMYNGKPSSYLGLHVSKLVVVDKKIVAIVIKDKKGNVKYKNWKEAIEKDADGKPIAYGEWVK